MATIRKRGQRWHVLIRKAGYAPLSRSFQQKTDALVWARSVETDFDRHGLQLVVNSRDNSTTVTDLLLRYDKEVSSRKRSYYRERYFLTGWQKHPIAKYSATKLNAAHISRARDELLKHLKPASVCRMIDLLRHVFNVARRDWGLPIAVNPVQGVSRPKVINGRERRLAPGELDALRAGCKGGTIRYLEPLILLALETGMRRGELLALTWSNVSWDRSTLFLPTSKNGYPRTVPLSGRARQILLDWKSLCQGGTDQIDAHPQYTYILTGAGVEAGEKVFRVSANAVRLAWERVCRRAGVQGLNFHDLRHEAISRFFERGLSIPEVALISGHRDFRMLARYTHLKAEEIARKLAG